MPRVHDGEVAVGRDYALGASNQACHRRSAKTTEKNPAAHMSSKGVWSWQRRKFLLLVSRNHGFLLFDLSYDKLTIT
jgi:hypothetical protein